MRLNAAVLVPALSAPIVLTGCTAQIDFLRKNGLPWSPLRDAPYMHLL